MSWFSDSLIEWAAWVFLIFITYILVQDDISKFLARWRNRRMRRRG